MTGPPNCARPSHTDHHFVSTASCVKTTHAPPTEKLGCYEIDTNISSAYENWAIFSRRKLLIVLELLHLKMEVTVSEPCDVIRVRVLLSTTAFHARVRGSVPSLGGLKETKNVSFPSTCESQYCGEPP